MAGHFEEIAGMLQARDQRLADAWDGHAETFLQDKREESAAWWGARVRRFLDDVRIFDAQGSTAFANLAADMAYRDAIYAGTCARLALDGK